MRVRILPGGYAMVEAGSMTCTFPLKGKDRESRREFVDDMMRDWFNAVQVGKWHDDRAAYERKHKPALKVVRRTA